MVGGCGLGGVCDPISHFACHFKEVVCIAKGKYMRNNNYNNIIAEGSIGERCVFTVL